jgi:hypothetical protein
MLRQRVGSTRVHQRKKPKLTLIGSELCGALDTGTLTLFRLAFNSDHQIDQLRALARSGTQQPKHRV